MKESIETNHSPSHTFKYTHVNDGKHRNRQLASIWFHMEGNPQGDASWEGVFGTWGNTHVKMTIPEIDNLDDDLQDIREHQLLDVRPHAPYEGHPATCFKDEPLVPTWVPRGGQGFQCLSAFANNISCMCAVAGKTKPLRHAHMS